MGLEEQCNSQMEHGMIRDMDVQEANLIGKTRLSARQIKSALIAVAIIVKLELERLLSSIADHAQIETLAEETIAME